MNRCLIFTLTLNLIFTLSCTEGEGPTSQELVSTKKEEAKKLFESFYACYEIAKDTPPFQTDFIDYPAQDVIVNYPESNVYQIGFESFKDLSLPLLIELDGTRRREHADMAQLFKIDLSGYKEPHNYPLNEGYSYHSHDLDGETICKNAILHFLNTKYLLINRVQESLIPHVFNDNQYVQGYSIGDVLVFNLETIDLIGGFTFDVKSPESYSLKEGLDAGSNLKAELTMSVYNKIKSKFKKLTPCIPSNQGFEF
ncbi:hypothetical protein [Crocinitomix algicola]|uniref:hypothetical protein n=1 Tax=Crocinitomix algicola TaxID=1740263 RepID=UPI00087258CC|nr:hypothetical protein [Crocinitomix algicola]